MDTDAQKPGKGLLGWLGRQVGYVRTAAKLDVSPEKRIYQNKTIEEAPLPGNPSVLLRRTIIDEAVDTAPGIRKEEKKNA